MHKIKQGAIKRLDIHFPVFQDTTAPSLREQLNVIGYPFKRLIESQAKQKGYQVIIRKLYFATPSIALPTG